LRKSTRALVIASRRSLLARVQAAAVGRALLKLHAGLVVEYLWIESEGDRQSEIALAASGGKGLFARAVERALLDRRADVAVHSLKDVPTDLTPGLVLAAIPRRADARDCLIAAEAQTIETLPYGATVGSASPRRGAQLRRIRGDLSVQLLRGNIDTRLAKVLAQKQVDATLLSVAGLQRAGLGKYADKPLDPEQMLPSAAQGALALQCRLDDHDSIARCLPLNDPVAAAAVQFERQVVAMLGGACHSPIAVYAQPADVAGRVFAVRARVLSPDGQTCLESRLQEVATDELSAAAERTANALLSQGAAAVLRAAAP
jgi:hydroxymethylbilane synthase